MNTFSCVLLFFLITLILGTVSPHGFSHSNKVELFFIVVFKGYNIEYEFDKIFVKCLINIKVLEGNIEILVEDLSISELPLITSYIGRSMFINVLIHEWINNIDLFNKTGKYTGSKTYVSVNGEIIEAVIYEDKTGRSFRDPGTGLYLGGHHVFSLNIGKNEEKIIYRIESTSYLITIKPSNLVYNMNIIRVNTFPVVFTTIFLSLLVVFMALKTIIKHTEYEII